LFGEIIGPLASLRNVQTYGFSKEQCEETIEALYRFPLPAHAAVTSVNVRFGDTEIVTELAEREDAETAYEEAKRMGQQATLITRESPDVFTLRIAGTCPDQDVQVATSYVQLAKPQGSGWSIRVPLTTAPRFVRGDEIGSRYANGQPMEIARDPGHKFALSLLIKGAASVDSDTHELESTSDSEGLRVRLRGSEVVLDRDCVISWHPEETKQKPVFDVYLHKDEDSGKVYFLSYITPPTAYLRMIFRSVRLSSLLITQGQCKVLNGKQRTGPQKALLAGWPMAISSMCVYSIIVRIGFLIVQRLPLTSHAKRHVASLTEIRIVVARNSVLRLSRHFVNTPQEASGHVMFLSSLMLR